MARTIDDWKLSEHRTRGAMATAAVLAALASLHSPQQTNEGRRQATELCDSFKVGGSNEASALGVAGELLDASSSPDVARHFALQLLSHAIEGRWNSEEFEPQRLPLRQRLLQLLAQPPPGCAFFVRQKLGALVASVALREWPQRWPELFEQLGAIAQMGEDEAELVLITVRTLGEEVMEYNSELEGSRRSDLTAALNEVALPAFMPFVYTVLDGSYARLSTDATLDAAARERLQRLLRAVLSLLCAYMEWIPLAIIFQNNFVPALCRLLLEDSLRTPVCEALLLLATRPVLKAGSGCVTKAECELASAQVVSMLQVLEGLIPSAMAIPADEQEAYHFVMRFCRLVTELCEHQLDVFLADPTELQRALGVLLRLSAHPSALVGSFPLRIWGIILRKQRLRENATVQGFFGQLAGQTLHLLPRVGRPTEGNTHARAQFSAVDFEDDVGAYDSFYGLAHNQVLMVVQALVTAAPVQMAQMAHEQVQLLAVADPQSCGLDAPAEEAQVAILAWVESVMSTADFADASETGATLRGVGAGVVVALLRYAPSAATLVQKRLHCLGRCANCLSHDDERLRVVLGTMFTAAVCRDQSASAGSNDVYITRTCGCAGVSRICSHLSSAADNTVALRVALPVVLESYQAIFQELSWAQQSVILCALINLSNHVPQLQERCQLLDEILRPKVELWAQFSAPLASLSAFATFLKLEALSSAGDAEAPDLSDLDLTRHLLLLFSSACRRCALMAAEGGQSVHPFHTYIAAVLPNMCTFVRLLHQLWDPETISSMPPEMSAALGMSVAERKGWLGRCVNAGIVVLPPTAASSAKNPGEMLCKFLQQWAAEMRDFAYTSCAASFRPEFGLPPEQFSGVASALFSGIDHLSTVHLHLVVSKVLVSFVSGCPDQLRPTVLDPALQGLFVASNARIEAGWQQHAAAATAEDEGEDDEAAMIGESVLRALSRQLVERISELLPAGGKETGPKTAALGPKLEYCLFGSEAIAAPMLTLLTSCVRWPDEAAASASIRLLSKVVVHAAARQSFHSWLTDLLVPTLLTALLTGSNAEVHAEMISLLHSVYTLLVEGTRAVLATIPGVSMEAVASLEQQMAEAGTESKRQRQLLKAFLKQCAGAKIEAWKKAPSVLAIPEKMVIMNQLQVSVGQPGDPEDGVGALFGGSDDDL